MKQHRDSRRIIIIFIITWFFGGWPQMFHFPPKVKVAYAAVPLIESVTISNQPSNSASFVMNMPAVRPDGDLYIAVVGKDDDPVITPPGGWNPIIDLAPSGNSQGPYGGAWYRIGSSEPASYTFTGDSEQWAGAMIRISGIDTVNPIHASSSDHDSSNGVPVAPSITPTINDTLILRIAAVDADVFGAGYAPPGTNPEFEEQSGSGNSGRVSAAASEDGPAADTATGTATFGGGVNDSWIAGTIAIAPVTATAVKLISFAATAHESGVLLSWRTGFDVDNLGWHVYREMGSERVRLTSEWIAGSALTFGPGIRLNAGNSYRWWDPSGRDTDRYWITDRDLKGPRTWHGPVLPVVTDTPLPNKRYSTLVNQVGRMQSSRTKAHSMRSERRIRYQNRMAKRHVVTASQTRQPWEYTDLQPHTVQQALAAAPAVQLLIREPGFFRVAEPDLVLAGLDPNVNPRRLQLFVDGQQQSIVVTGEADGRFDPQDAIEFYGTGLDTPWTDTQTYWLVAGSQPGKRVLVERNPIQGAPPPQSFPATVARQERRLYLATVKNGDEQNFFGAVIGTASVEQALFLHHLDSASPESARLEVVLQGVTPDAHHVTIQINGREVGTMDFSGQTREVVAFPIPHVWLQHGENVVTLVPRGDEDDISVVDHIRLTYWHTYTADDDALTFTAPGHRQVMITDFHHPDIRALDITSPQAVRELSGYVAAQGTSYAFTVTADGEGERTLFAFTDTQVKTPAAIMANVPSTWHHATQGADLVIISHGAFLESVAPLKAVREAQGWRVVLVDVEDVYDEFNFGHKSPWAIRNFLHHATTSWQTPPRFVLLVGDASFDSRGYLELDDVDFVPTKLVTTAFLETASDGWFADFDEDGVPELAVGRLPVQTAEEAANVVAKLVHYAESGTTGIWTQEALFIADDNDIFDFAAASADMATLLSSNLKVESLFLDQLDVASVRAGLLSHLNKGKLLVNYIGHGSTEVWAGEELLTSTDARTLTNGERLPVVVAMNCLNGFFHDLYTESLAEALLKSEQGGAVAVWASSGLTGPSAQAVMNHALVRALFGEEGFTLGEAIMQAQSTVIDRDVQRTWMLFGDPTLRMKSPSKGTSTLPPPETITSASGGGS